MALPSIATLLDIELPQSNMIISEEENHSSSSFVVFEKTIPKTLNVHDFIKFFETSHKKEAFLLADDSIHLTPYLSIFSLLILSPDPGVTCLGVRVRQLL